MSESFYLGIDQGSSSTKGVLYSATGEVCHVSRIPVKSFGEASDRIEQDPVELLKSVQTVIHDAIEFAQEQRREIAAIGLSCQRSGVCAWNEQETLTPLLTWRNRSAIDRTASLSDSERHGIQEKTFLAVLPEYAAPKIGMLQERYHNAFIATLDSYLAYHLCDERPYVTDDTMASRTMLYAVRDGSWDDRLAACFSVKKSRLPSIVGSASSIGTIRGIPLCTLLGDGQAAVIGMTIRSGNPVLNMGTVTSLCVPTGRQLAIHPGYPSGVLYSNAEERSYFLEGLVTSSGSQTDFIHTQLGVSLETLDASIQSARDSDWTAYLPLRGTGSPDFSYERPSVISSKERVGKSEFARAALEHIAFSVCALVDSCEKAGELKRGVSVIVSGGIARYETIRAVLACCSQHTYTYAVDEEASARGAAFMACVQHDPEGSRLWRSVSAEPIDQRHDSAMQQRYLRWLELRTEAQAPGVHTLIFRPDYDTERILQSS